MVIKIKKVKIPKIKTRSSIKSILKSPGKSVSSSFEKYIKNITTKVKINKIKKQSKYK